MHVHPLPCACPHGRVRVARLHAQEDGGVFWMTWDDFRTYFAEVTVCRLRPEYVEARQGGWLPSVFGAGQAVAIEVYARTQLELTIHQESHTNRGETSFATHIDLGLAVMREGGAGGAQAADDDGGGGFGGLLMGGGLMGGGGGGGSPALELVAHGERTMHSSLSIDATLESDGFTSRYLVVPMCFGHLASPEPRKFALAALSTQPLSLETVTLPAAQVATAAIAVAVQHGDKQGQGLNGGY